MNESNKSRDTLAQTGFSTTAQRAPEDYYETPEWATLALLDRETFAGSGLEPACGAGAICRVLASKRLSFTSSDIREDGLYLGAHGGLNFLLAPFPSDALGWIITNPPFKSAQAFAERALSLSPKVALFVRLQFLEGQERYKFFKSHPPARIYVFSSRVACLKDGQPQPAIMSFAWFVWDKSAPIEAPRLFWIEPKK